MHFFQTFPLVIALLNKPAYFAMDPVTHLALGACTGEIIIGKKLGKKALLYGALVANLPDIDTIAALFFSPAKGYLIHRGITHSLFFAMVAGICLALAAQWLHRKLNIPLLSLWLFCGVELALHDLLDTCTSYGTGLLEPFSHQRFSIHLIYVADPLFTIWLLIAAILLIRKSTVGPHRKRLAWVALSISLLYLCFAAGAKTVIDKRAIAWLAVRGITPKDYLSTPAPFNCMLWYEVTAVDTGYYTAYCSVWDNSRRPVAFAFHQKNYASIKNDIDTAALHNLTEFSDHFYTITHIGNNKYINILRFGQIQGWQHPDAPFAFSFPLNNGGGDDMLLQKGRLVGWDWNSIKGYVKRIEGN
jgi:inner membrane protein